jgi:hypothetical protein
MKTNEHVNCFRFSHHRRDVVEWRTTGDRERTDTPSTSRERLARASSSRLFVSPNSRTARKHNGPTRESTECAVEGSTVA